MASIVLEKPIVSETRVFEILALDRSVLAKTVFRRMRGLMPCALSGLVLLQAGFALAEGLESAPPPSIDVSVPPPAAPVERRQTVHEGFYTRASVGLGSTSATVDVGGGDVSSDGVALSFEALVGGSPGPGFTLGGAVSFATQLSGNWDGAPGSGDVSVLLVGPFVDGFPNPFGGWHFGATAGLARVGFDAGDGSDSALGVGAAAWVGHDTWVSPEWCVGGQLRLDAHRASASDDSIDTTVSRIGVGLQFTVLYN